MGSPPSFGPLAPHYDVLMRDVPYAMWVEYYQLLLARHADDPRRLLDVACGTGTVAEMLAKRGFTVHGFDLSPEMIEVAQQRARKAKSGLSFEACDAAEFVSDQPFDAAYSFFDSLNYIIDPHHLARAITRVARSLRPGGTFVFDMNTAYAFEAQMFDQTETRKNARIRYTWRGKYDRKSRIIRVEMDFERNGTRFQEVHVQRAYDSDEVREMLKDAGFERVAEYESYTLDPPQRASDRVHYVAIMPGRNANSN